jgi:NADH dehydrogenase
MKKSGTFWLAFLRIFVGLRFLLEGINKIQSGWLGTSEHLVSGASSYLWSAGTPDFYVTLMETFVVPNQVFFQRVIVITELIVGLALIAGLFTFIFALVSIAMSANFVIGAMGSTAGIWEPLWIFLISITLLAGAGRAFGLDYYVMPWLFNLNKKPVSYRKDRSA